MSGSLKAVVSGKLSRDPEMTFGETGSARTKASIPVDDYNFSTKETTTRWMNLVAFGQTAERIDKICSKGTVIQAVGRYEPRIYKDKNNKPALSHDFVIETFDIVAWAPKSESTSASSAPSDSGDWDMGDLDDHPF